MSYMKQNAALILTITANRRKLPPFDIFKCSNKGPLKKKQSYCPMNLSNSLHNLKVGLIKK